MTRLTLERGKWYGWTMYPGYGDEAYYSPIWVRELAPLGDRQFRLDFFNLAYAAGVQDTSYTLKTLKREATYLVAAQPDSDRTVIIEPLTKSWFRQHYPLIADEIKTFAVRTDTEQIACWLQRQTRVHLESEAD